MPEPEYTSKGANFSPCGKYRYLLWRTWSPGPVLLWVMLNPSTADAEVLDPTVCRCVDFARRWGYGGIQVVNLFAYRSTDPKHLLEVQDPVGPANDQAIEIATGFCDKVIAAWGVTGRLKRRDISVRKLIRNAGKDLYCMKLTRRQDPAHPLYLPGSLEPVLYLSTEV